MQEENLFTEMNEDDIAERVRNFMQALTKNNSADWERSILVELQNADQEYASTFILWLEVSGILPRFLAIASQDQNRFLASKFPQILATIDNFCEDFFVTGRQNIISVQTKRLYNQVMQMEKIRLIYLDARQNINFEAQNLNQGIYGLMKRMEYINNINANFAQAKRIIQLINTYNPQDNIFSQVCLIWLKSKCDQILGRIQQGNRNNFCCKSSYYQKQEFQEENLKNHHFANDTSPQINNAMRIDFLKRLVISYLNNPKGGVCFLGIRSKQKRKTIIGIPIAINMARQLLQKSFTDILGGVLPDLERNQTYQQIHNRVHGKIYLNQYIWIDYHAIRRAQFQYTRAKTEKGQYLYVVRLFVKPGNPTHYYHLIIQQQIKQKQKYKQEILHFFKLNDKGATKLDLPQGSEELKKRIQFVRQNHQKFESQENAQIMHEKCLFNLFTPFSVEIVENDETE